VGNIPLKRLKKMSVFRRIALGTWRTEYDPQVYGSLAIRMDKAVQYIDAFREKTGKRLTITHLVGKATAATIKAMPDANAILRFGYIYLRQNIVLSFQVATVDADTGKLDLSALTIRDVDEKSVEQIVDEFEEQVANVRSGQDQELEKARGMFKWMPPWLTGFVLNTLGFLGYTLNLNLSWMGVPKDPFGSAMVTNVGSLGLETAYAPLVPYSHCPLVLAIGAMKEEAVVDNGQVVPGQVMRIFATFDHRIMDGSHAAKMSEVLRTWLENPFDHFDSLD
jgi:pyruvate/2-oxoglutarate dehydrogenase complex dihydrolipoamide acyltransferase (E2) component